MLEIDFNQLGKDNLPVAERSTENKSLLKSLLSRLQATYNIFIDYMSGSSASAYSAGTYSIYAQVKYKGAIYESLVSGNTSLPTDTTKWRKILNSSVGTNESQYYNGGKLQFEYALNRHFGLTWVNPPSSPPIFINNNVKTIQQFFVGELEDLSSTINTLTSSELVPLLDIANVSFYALTINVPSAFYASLGVDAEMQITSIADKYITTGIFYDINQY